MTFSCEDLKLGDICITRGGLEVQYVGRIFSEEIRPFVFHCDEGIYRFFENGNWSEPGRGRTNHLDIISKKPEKRALDVWVNVYATSASFHADKEKANCLAQADRIACIHIRQEYEEGEGL